MSAWTPDTARVRRAWVYARSVILGRNAQMYADEFDRWLATEKAKAWDEGFTRGFYDQLAGGDRDACESSAINPYYWAYWKEAEHG